MVVPHSSRSPKGLLKGSEISASGLYQPRLKSCLGGMPASRGESRFVLLRSIGDLESHTSTFKAPDVEMISRFDEHLRRIYYHRYQTRGYKEDRPGEFLQRRYIDSNTNIEISTFIFRLIISLARPRFRGIREDHAI